MDNRIGTRKDGKTTWPEVDITGQSYPKPPGTTVGLGKKGYFAVLPINFVDQGEVEQLREIVAGLPATEAASPVGDAQASSEALFEPTTPKRSGSTKPVKAEPDVSS